MKKFSIKINIMHDDAYNFMIASQDTKIQFHASSKVQLGNMLLYNISRRIQHHVNGTK